MNADKLIDMAQASRALNNTKAALSFTPIGSGVLLQTPPIEETTKAGIIKGDATVQQERFAWDGTFLVLRTGRDVRKVKPGQSVFLRQGTSLEPIQINGEKFLWVDEYAILGYINESNTQN